MVTAGLARSNGSLMWAMPNVVCVAIHLRADWLSIETRFKPTQVKSTQVDNFLFFYFVFFKFDGRLSVLVDLAVQLAQICSAMHIITEEGCCSRASG